ncbi:motility associated factor glycosyltransferase family protein [Pseudoalteromonas sp. meg-B1]|uniref:motility associated factor glycosyltransferase family protein n=1 Tax=Pseudoalteromonas sp. meg-B1 TaxID=2203192 RepID=UPI000D6FF597|nr:6-hydroxymethylpterin diphosphokinase MptE-like protein [Pseudoalteromonas sp. meg-B1]PWS55657.1 hypothetical protein DK924_02495 [Pseudoalteromonas sp. meg-B1]
MDANQQELTKMMLQATLLANLALLKEQMPALYEVFKDYSPTDTGVAIDALGNANLFNNNEFVYQDSPREFACKQLTQFLDDPLYFKYELNHQEDKDILFEHAALLKSIYNVRASETDNKINNPAEEKRLDFVCFLGGGLGYQIEELLKKKDVLNVFLFEPSKDTFYALLHCIELRPLFNKCVANGGHFSIRVAGSEDGVINEISKFLFEHGHFNISQILFFKHYDSPLIEKTIARIKDVGHRWSAGWGFFEDEIIGLSHTISNLKAGFPVIKKAELFKNKLENSPVFIAANGPSLDSAIDFLKANQSNVIIVSCGTALKALLVNGIKPDIHIEMERVAFLLDWVEVVERTENIDTKLEELNIIALNTVYDGVLNRFKSAHLLSKINDCGGRFIRALDAKNQFVYPEHSNPTVSNTALAVVISLGFKKVYLTGTDFGFVSKDHHHSKHSIYFDKDFKHKETVEKGIQDGMIVKGNFRDEVQTTPIFDSSKGNIELLLQDNLDVKVFNTTDGAFIRYTEPMRIEDIGALEVIADKQNEISSLLKKGASLEQLSTGNVELKIKKIKNTTKYALEQLLSYTSVYFKTREELADVFSIQNKSLLTLRNGNDDDRVVYWLIQGSFRYFQAYIMTSSYYYHDLDKRVEFMNACVEAFNEHIKGIYLEFIQNYNKPAKV